MTPCVLPTGNGLGKVWADARHQGSFVDWAKEKRSIRHSGGDHLVISMLRRRPGALDWGSPWVFFALVFGVTWVFLIPIGFSGASIQDPLVFSAAALGLLGAIFVDLFLAYRIQGKAGLRDFWLRAVDPRRVSLGWYAVIFLSQPVFTGLAVLTHLALGGAMPSLDTPARFLANPLSIIPFAAFILLYGPLPEELGWRGWVLDRLQLRYNALVSSLILGFFWGVWHIPLFFIAGTYQREQMGSVASLVAGTIIYSVLMTWIYNNNYRSTLSAVLFHFSLNFTGEFFAFPVIVKDYVLAWNALLAVVVVAVGGLGRLANPSGHPVRGDQRSPDGIRRPGSRAEAGHPSDRFRA